MKHQKLRLLLTNAFGLKSKIGELAHLVKSTSPDVVIVTETKFSPSKISDAEASLPGFAPPIRRDRTEHGGGVAVWVKSNLAFQHLQQVNCRHHEVVWLSLAATDRTKIVFCAVYRPGSCSSSDTELLEYLDSELEAARLHGEKVIVAGDFNVHNELWLRSNKTTPAGEFAEEFCYLHGLEQHVDVPTRGCNTLDLVMSDFLAQVNVQCLAPLGASDHAVIQADFPISAFKEPITQRTVWRYNQADWGRLQHFYRTYDWSSTIQDCPDRSCSNITSAILAGMKRYIPSRQLASRPTDPPWWTPECSDAVHSKQRAWRSYRSQPTAEIQEAAKQATEYCKSVLERSKCAHLATLRRKLSAGNMSERSWWSTIKRASGNNRNSTIPTLHDQKGREHISNAEKAECFGEYFASKCSLGTNDFPANLPEDKFPRIRQRTSAKLTAVHFRHGAVRRELRQLNPSKATGPDGIPARVLKSCADELCRPLARLFSLCFYKETQPRSWKVARVVPVYKKKSKSLPQNYRPVSLLSILSKVMESIVNRQVMNFLEKHEVLSPRQFGFRRGLGTADLLTKLHGEWARAAGSGGAVHVLAIDIAGAFDKVSHAGLLFKAAACGIGGPLHAWLASYLHDRQIHTVVAGQQSSLFPIKSGVPQGSILGPTLFLLYVNDSEDILPEGTDLCNYADDTTLYQCISAHADSINSAGQLQAAVNAIAEWGARWKITFEPTKSQALTVSHQRPAHLLPPIIFSGTSVPEEEHIKLLGVTFDRQLSYTTHLHGVASKAAQRIHFLKKTAHLLDARGRATVYRGFVRPVMEYCCLVWMGASTLARLDRIQHRALKVIGPGIHLPSLHHRRMVSALAFLYKLWYLPAESPLKTLLPPKTMPRPLDSHPTRLSLHRSTCHQFQLSTGLPRRSRNSVLQAFPACAVSTWNSLPSEIIPSPPSCKQLQQFKQTVNAHLTRLDWLNATDAL